MNAPSPVLQDLISLHAPRYEYDANGVLLGARLGLAGQPLLPCIVVSSDAPVDDDGRPDGTIWVQQA